MNTQFDIDITKIDLPGMIMRDGFDLRWHSRQWDGPCPFCGGTDRFRVHEKGIDGRWVYTCRKCKAGGDAITYLRERHNMSFAEACDALGVASTTPILRAPKLTYASTAIEARSVAWQKATQAFAQRCANTLWSSVGASALAYLHGRGFNNDTLRKFCIGYNAKSIKLGGKWWAWRGITIPRYQADELWAVNVRRRQSDIEAAKRHNVIARQTGQGEVWNDGKYVMVAGGTPRVLFNADALRMASMSSPIHTVIVTGGEFDAMSVMQCAPTGVHAITLGGEAINPTQQHREELSSYRVFICSDNDEAGEACGAKWLAAISDAIRIHAPIGKDLNDSLRAGVDLHAWLAGLNESGPAHVPI